jgi:hypothetical protein
VRRFAKNGFGDKQEGRVMRIDAVTRWVLGVIALLLGILAVRPMLAPEPSQAAKIIRYKVVSDSFQTFADLETSVNLLGMDGWEVITSTGSALVLRRSSS